MFVASRAAGSRAGLNAESATSRPRGKLLARSSGVAPLRYGGWLARLRVGAGGGRWRLWLGPVALAGER
ncbi:MAG: hypothetical protein WA484_04830, partial [Solirubrobacteraceae bacterium]